MDIPVFVRDFREAAPYIDYLRGKTLVIGIASDILENRLLHPLAADITLLASLGVRLVLVHGSRRQINELEQNAGTEPRYHEGRRITGETTLTRAKQACGMLRSDIEAALSVGMGRSLQRGRRLHIASGNFISAKPYGIINGTDMGYTGRIRKIDTESINQRLDDGAVVLLSPLGTSLSGTTYNLSMADIAESAAIALRAEKLIFIIRQEGILDDNGRLLTNLSAREARTLISSNQIHTDQHRLLRASITAVENRVERAQILSGLQDGSLISELFTRAGSGTSIASEPFVHIRKAENSDIPDLIRLIRPLENQGILLPRSREYLEHHISEFSVLEHDRQIYGCVALKQFPENQTGELACLAVSPDAQDSGYGKLLLEHTINQSRTLGLRKLLALSTHTGDWFLERGFQIAGFRDLPPQRRSEYEQSGRKSNIFSLNLP